MFKISNQQLKQGLSTKYCSKNLSPFSLTHTHARAKKAGSKMHVIPPPARFSTHKA